MDYMCREKLSVKVLDFVQCGGGSASGTSLDHCLLPVRQRVDHIPAGLGLTNRKGDRLGVNSGEVYHGGPGVD